MGSVKLHVKGQVKVLLTAILKNIEDGMATID